MKDFEPYGKLTWESDGTSGKIKQMALKDSALVEIIRIESPYSIFVRPLDHIRDSLIYREPYYLAPLEKVEAGCFALAPIEDRAFGRCIILANESDDTSCRVFYIDEAVTALVSRKCLFEIEDSQRCIPWQVMHVSLSRLINLSGGEWSFEQCSSFAKVLLNFDFFQITACQVDLLTSPVRPTLLVNMYGLDNIYDTDKAISIEEMCIAFMKNVSISLFPVNLMGSNQLVNLDTPGGEIEVFRQELPKDWLNECSQNWMAEDPNWTVGLRVVEWNALKFKEIIDENGCFYCLVDVKTVDSPSDMIIYPFVPNSEMDENWFLEKLGEMANYLRQLHDFYSNSKNQKPLSYEEIKTSLEKGKLYAIVSSPHLSTKWARCEILELLNLNSVTVRFLDNGRNGVQKLKTLFRIHKVHTNLLPFTIRCGRTFPELSTTGCSENEQENSEVFWSKNKYSVWKKFVSFDTPLIAGTHFDILGNEKLQITSLKNLDGKVLFDQNSTPSQDEYRESK